MTSPTSAARAAIEEGTAFQKAGQLDLALRRFTTAAGADDPALSTEALWRRASVHRLRAEWDAAFADVRAAQDLAERHALREPFAESVQAEAIVHHAKGEFEAAVPRYERVLTLSGAPKTRGVALQNLAAIAAQRGDITGARPRFLEAAAAFRAAGFAWGEATVYCNFARAALDIGNYAMAAGLLDDAHGAARRVGDQDLLSLVRMNRAEATLGLGDAAQAMTMAEDALMHFTVKNNVPRQIECLRVIGDVCRAQGDLVSADACYEQALGLADAHGVVSEVTVLATRREACHAPASVAHP